MTEKQLISALLYGVISLLVAYFWVFLYAREYRDLKNGSTTLIEIVPKVFLSHIFLIFFFILLFNFLDIVLPLEYKPKTALDLFWAGADMSGTRTIDPWMAQMKTFTANIAAGIKENDKYFISMIIYMVLLVFYIMDIVLPVILLFLVIGWMVNRNKVNSGNISDDSMLSKGLKGFLMYVSAVVFLYIHMNLGSAGISSLTTKNVNLYEQLVIHITGAFHG